MQGPNRDCNQTRIPVRSHSPCARASRNSHQTVCHSLLRELRLSESAVPVAAHARDGRPRLWRQLAPHSHPRPTTYAGSRQPRSYRAALGGIRACCARTARTAHMRARVSTRAHVHRREERRGEERHVVVCCACHVVAGSAVTRRWERPGRSSAAASCSRAGLQLTACCAPAFGCSAHA